MDRSIELESVRNILEVEHLNNVLDLHPTNNIIDISLTKVETLFQFVSPAQVVVENREVD